MKRSGFVLFMCVFVQVLYGQYQIGIIPRMSPDKAVYQKVGYTEVEVKYGSPSVSSRQVWGELVPHNKVWRAGANNATTVEFSSPVILNGTALDSGIYALFVIPKERGPWTAIFNKVHKQWGAFSYDETEDALRIEVSPRSTALKTETLSYSITQDGFSYGTIVLAWDLIELEIAFETNYLREFEQVVESRAAAQSEFLKWIPYLQGAEHLEEINADLELATKWINKAEQIMNATSEWNEQFYPRDYIKGHLFWTKAKVLARAKDLAAAVEYVDKLKAIEGAAYYTKKNEKGGIDRLYNSWKG